MEEEKESELTIEEMIDDLGQELLATGFSFVKRAGKGDKPTEEEIDAHTAKHKHFRDLCSTYNMLKKNGRVGNTGNPNFNKDFLKKVKDQPSSIANIISQIPASFEQKECPKCNQVTNHLKDICQNCKDEKTTSSDAV